MKISDGIKELERILNEEGDLKMVVSDYEIGLEEVGHMEVLRDEKECGDELDAPVLLLKRF